MKKYLLAENEVILFKGIGILLTNFNFVEIIETKKMFKKAQTEIKTHPISEVKLYEGVPQLRQENNTVIIYFSDKEVIVNFDTKINVIKFLNAINKLITGKTFSERGAVKAKVALNLVDDTLGIKTVDTIKGFLENGAIGTAFGGIGKIKKRTIKAKDFANNIVDITGVTDRFFGDKITDDIEVEQIESHEKSYKNQIEMLKEFKELMDIGVLSEEEFNKKKKEILES